MRKRAFGEDKVFFATDSSDSSLKGLKELVKVLRDGTQTCVILESHGNGKQGEEGSECSERGHVYGQLNLPSAYPVREMATVKVVLR